MEHMRWIIKMILFPISLILSVLAEFLTFLFGVGTVIFYLLMILSVIVSISYFLQGNTTIGIITMVLGFLLSPRGIPRVGAVIEGFIKRINDTIKSI